jgi:hypothetical protein
MAPVSPDWEDIRRAYESSHETVAVIAAHFGVAAREVSRRANLKDSGWLLRPRGTAALVMARARSATQRLEESMALGSDGASLGPVSRLELATDDNDPTAPALKSATAQSGGATHRRALIRRLYNVLDAKLGEVEARIIARKKLSGADTEREARQLANLIKTFEKLTELSDAPIRSNKPTSATPDATEDDAERLRQDITQRFERLRQQQAPAASVG